MLYFKFMAQIVWKDDLFKVRGGKGANRVQTNSN